MRMVLLISMIVIAPFLGCTMTTNKDTAKESQVKVVLQKLDEMPDWTDSSSWTKAEKQEYIAKIMNVLRFLREYDLDVIRQALVEYESDTNKDTSKLYVVNKYLFNWPEKAPTTRAAAEPGRGTNEQVLSMWPFSVGTDGDIILTGKPNWFYAGPPYMAVCHFDDCRKIFGPRQWKIGKK